MSEEYQQTNPVDKEKHATLALNGRFFRSTIGPPRPLAILFPQSRENPREPEHPGINIPQEPRLAGVYETDLVRIMCWDDRYNVGVEWEVWDKRTGESLIRGGWPKTYDFPDNMNISKRFPYCGSPSPSVVMEAVLKAHGIELSSVLGLYRIKMSVAERIWRAARKAASWIADNAPPRRPETETSQEGDAQQSC